MADAEYGLIAFDEGFDEVYRIRINAQFIRRIPARDQECVERIDGDVFDSPVNFNGRSCFFTGNRLSCFYADMDQIVPCLSECCGGLRVLNILKQIGNKYRDFTHFYFSLSLPSRGNQPQLIIRSDSYKLFPFR